jgi:hypothetical protein
MECGHDLTEDLVAAKSEAPRLQVLTKKEVAAVPPEPKWPMKIIWPGVLVITLLFGYTLTPRDALEQLLVQGGVGDEGVQMIAFAAGCAFPATLGFLIGTLLFLRTGLRNNNSNLWLVFSAVFVISAVVCNSLELGLPVTWAGERMPNAPPAIGIPLLVISVYINSYTYGLFITAAAIGIAAGLQIDNWLNRYSKAS